MTAPRSALVVDDSRPIRSMLRKMLESLGFGVAEAVDGADALEQLRAGAHPALVLVDWNMPNLNGLEFVKAVRRDPGFGDVRLVMQTTETEMDFVAQALEAGADEYVMKPFTEEILTDKLALLGFTGA